MECPTCHSKNPSDSRFCRKCGTQIPVLEGLPPTSLTDTIQAPISELSSGARFARRYQIIEELGAGGMGKVYKVFDTEIMEQVALKLLKPEVAADQQTIARFQNELKLARKISHRNVCRMHDLGREEGTYFITMEYIAGEDLKRLIRKVGSFSPAKAIALTRQICEGLAEAHRLGVVHRDLKPQNIMVDEEGNVRIMDFGIARTTRAKGITDGAMMIGTPEYMSPEQVNGKEADQRSDIYSLGVLLYEMMTGKVPFEGDTPFSIGMMHKNVTAKNPMDLNEQIPDSLSRMIMKCLEKDPDKRFQTAAALLSYLEKVEEGLTDLRRNGWQRSKKAKTAVGPTAGRIHSLAYLAGGLLLLVGLAAVLMLMFLRKRTIDSIAVLYFDNTNPSPETEYLGDGIPESLINKLQELPTLKTVIASSSVAQYKGKTIDPKKVGAELNVRGILTGKIRRLGDGVTISVELVDAADGSLIWSHPYEQKLTNIFALQEEISQGIIDKLRLKISKEEKKRLAKRTTANVEAYQAYLKGRFYWNKRTKVGLLKGLTYFQEAIDTDPGYALAYSGLADSYTLLARYSYMPPGEAMPRGLAAALKALEIDADVGEAHNSLAFVRRYYEFNWSEAEREYKRAIELSPNYATAHHWYALFLMMLKRNREALGEIRRALELDPLSLIINTNIAWCHYFAREYGKAVDLFQKALEMDPNYAVALQRLGETYVQMNRFQEAIETLKKAVALSPDSPDIIADLGYAYAVSGNRVEAKKIIEDLEVRSNKIYVSSYDMSVLYLGLGQKPQALGYLEHAYVERASYLSNLGIDPRMDGLRLESRFKALATKLKLE